ncbi:hypothetical protein BC828DRAFT_377205 [Blastocladiella britannica]|nr:hypothetical protein BC828DRAFT_377205 [Blastocladiella britannica]
MSSPNTTSPGKGVPSLGEFCRTEAKASLKCLEDNGYNKSACSALFQDYIDCKKGWQKLRKDANRR